MSRTSRVQNITGESSVGKDLGTQAVLNAKRDDETPIIYNGQNVKEKVSFGLFSTNNYDTTNLGYDKFYPSDVDVEKDDILDFYFKVERENSDGELVAFTGENETIKRKYYLLGNVVRYLQEHGGNGDGEYAPLFHKHNKLWDADLSHITLSTITELGNLVHNPSPHDIIAMDNDLVFTTGVENSFVLGSKNYSITQDEDSGYTKFASILSSRSTGIYNSSFAMILASEGEDLISPPIIDTSTGGDSDGIIGNIDIVGTQVNLTPDNLLDNPLFICPVQKHISPLQLELSSQASAYPISGDSGIGEGLVLYFAGDISGVLLGKSLLTAETVAQANCEYTEVNLKTNNAGEYFRVDTIGGEVVTIVFPAEGFEVFTNDMLLDITMSSTNINAVRLPTIGATTTETEIGVGEVANIMGICWGGEQTLQVYGTGQTINGGGNYAMYGHTNNNVTFTATADGFGGYYWVTSVLTVCPSYSTTGGGGTTPTLQEGSRYVVSFASYNSKLIGAKYSQITGYKNRIYGNGDLPRALFGKYGQLGSSTNTLFGIGNGTLSDSFGNTTNDFNLAFSVGYDIVDDEEISFIDFHNNKGINVQAGVDDTDAVNVSQLNGLATNVYNTKTNIMIYKVLNTLGTPLSGEINIYNNGDGSYMVKVHKENIYSNEHKLFENMNIGSKFVLFNKYDTTILITGTVQNELTDWGTYYIFIIEDAVGDIPTTQTECVLQFMVNDTNTNSYFKNALNFTYTTDSENVGNMESSVVIQNAEDISNLSFTHNSTLSSSSVFDMIELSNGKLLASYGTTLYTSLDGTTFTIVSTYAGTDVIYSLFESSSGLVVIGTSQGVITTDVNLTTFDYTYNTTPYYNCHDIIEITDTTNGYDGYIVFTSNLNLYYTTDDFATAPSILYMTLSTTTNFTSKIWKILEGSDGRIFVGGNGYEGSDVDGEFWYIDDLLVDDFTESSFTGKTTGDNWSDIYQLNNGDILACDFTGVWKSTNNGVSFTKIANGLMNDVYSILMLTNGFMMFGTEEAGSANLYLSTDNGETVTSSYNLGAFDDALKLFEYNGKIFVGTSTEGIYSATLPLESIYKLIVSYNTNDNMNIDGLLTTTQNVVLKDISGNPKYKCLNSTLVTDDTINSLFEVDFENIIEYGSFTDSDMVNIETI